MEKKHITNLILTSSILFFSACSSKSPEVSKTAKNNSSQALSPYSIIGIDKHKHTQVPLFVATREPVMVPLFATMHQAEIEESSFPVEVEELEPIAEVERTPPPMTIAMPKPVYENVSSYTHIEEPPSIEVISYASNPLENHPPKAPQYASNIEVISYGSKRGMNQLAAYHPPKNNYHSNLAVIKNEVEKKAKSFLGTKYVWGATGPSKFDCSGFTQWVYRDSGITIPRVSRDQAKVGNYVAYNDLRRGDMVFFDTKKHPQGKVTHVGIYLGNNNFIHASSAAKKVVIFNFDEKPYYKERFLWGRRVINNNYLALK